MYNLKQGDEATLQKTLTGVARHQIVIHPYMEPHGGTAPPFTSMCLPPTVYERYDPLHHQELRPTQLPRLFGAILFNSTFDNCKLHSFVVPVATEAVHTSRTRAPSLQRCSSSSFKARTIAVQLAAWFVSMRSRISASLA